MSPRKVEGVPSLPKPAPGELAAASLRRQRDYLCAAFGWWLEQAKPGAEAAAGEIEAITADLRRRAASAVHSDAKDARP